MKAALALTLLTLSGVSSLEERTRQLRKDYGYDASSSKSGKGSSKSSKSSYSSSKSTKASPKSAGYSNGYEHDTYDASSGKSSKGSSKSGKGSSKSGKSSGKSSKSGSSDGYGNYDGDAKAEKYSDLLKADDDDVFDLGYHFDDTLNSNSFEVDSGSSNESNGDDNYDDATQDDVEYYDDASLVVGGDDDVADAEESESAMGSEEDDSIEENTEANQTDDEEIDSGTSETDGNTDDSLTQNSWLTDLISGKEPTDDDFSMSMTVGDVELESMSVNFEGENLDQNSWLTDLISGKDPTDDDAYSMSMDLEASLSLDQNSWLTDLEPDDDGTMSMNVEADDAVEFESGSTVLVVDDVVLELDLESMSMGGAAHDMESSMAFGEHDANAMLGSSMSLDLDQADIDFGSMSMAGEDDAFANGTSESDDSSDGTIDVVEKDTTTFPNPVDDAVNESTDDGSSTSDGSSNSDSTDDASAGNSGTSTTTDSDDSIADDGAVDDDTKHMGDDEVGNANYLSQDQRTQIILEKCNTTPLGRALSLIEIIGNQVDPQAIVSQSADSPHYMAFLWLVYFDDAILCAPQTDANGISTLVDSRVIAFNTINNINETLDRIMQRYALAMLYFSFQGYGWDQCSSDRNLIDSSSAGKCVDSNGNELVRFLDAAHECEWFGIACSTNATDEMNVDMYYPVTHLELSSNNLHGYIPSEISLLYTLEVLDLRNNELTGTIPFGAFATMDSLDTLLLSGNDGLNGDASKYCQSSSLSDLLLFETDCTPVVEELSPAPVQCSCCTSCK
ncbi:hypothetical protein ACHAXN_012600 [Cyclotella atomus]